MNALLPRLVLVTVALTATGEVFSHHPMGGAVPATAWQGLLSGLGHPAIEVNHLLFLLGVAVAAAAGRMGTRLALVLLPSYVLAGALATALRAPGLEIPFAEAGVALSLGAVAVWLWVQRMPGALAGVLLAVLGGFIHGYAYGEAVIGAETTPLAAYLAGLVLVQSLLLIVVWWGTCQLVALVPTRVRASGRALGTVLGAAALWGGASLLA